MHRNLKKNIFFPAFIGSILTAAAPSYSQVKTTWSYLDYPPNFPVPRNAIEFDVSGATDGQLRVAKLSDLRDQDGKLVDSFQFSNIPPGYQLNVDATVGSNRTINGIFTNSSIANYSYNNKPITNSINAFIPNISKILNSDIKSLGSAGANVQYSLKKIPDCTGDCLGPDAKHASDLSTAGRQILPVITSEINYSKSGGGSQLASWDSSTWVALPISLNLMSGSKIATPLYMDEEDFLRFRDLMATAQYQIGQIIASSATSMTSDSSTQKKLKDLGSSWQSESAKYFADGFATTSSVSTTSPDLTQSKNITPADTPQAVRDELRRKRDVPQQYAKRTLITGGALGGCILGSIAIGGSLTVDKLTGFSDKSWGQVAGTAFGNCVAGAVTGVAAAGIKLQYDSIQAATNRVASAALANTREVRLAAAPPQPQTFPVGTVNFIPPTR